MTSVYPPLGAKYQGMGTVYLFGTKREQASVYPITLGKSKKGEMGTKRAKKLKSFQKKKQGRGMQHWEAKGLFIFLGPKGR